MRLASVGCFQLDWPFCCCSFSVSISLQLRRTTWGSLRFCCYTDDFAEDDFMYVGNSFSLCLWWTTYYLLAVFKNCCNRRHPYFFMAIILLGLSVTLACTLTATLAGYLVISFKRRRQRTECRRLVSRLKVRKYVAPTRLDPSVEG
eukprot:SAG11_NODE_2122_length_3784_cov_3.569878_6_plen_146_part_00